MKSLWKNSIWIFFIILMVLFLPSSLTMHAQTTDRSIAIAIGIDKLEKNMYEVSAEIVIPMFQTTFNQNAQVISAVGQNTSEALNGLSIHIGKIIGLSHCSAVILGNSLKDENIAELLDQILRGKRINYNTQLIFSNNSAKEILKKAVEIDGAYIQNINEILRYNDKFVTTTNTLVSSFFQTYYDNHGASLLPLINLSTNEYEGISKDNSSGSSGGQTSGESQGGESSGGSSQGGSGGSSQGGSSGGGGESSCSQSQQPQYFSNNGESAIFKKGKYLTSLSTEQVKQLGLLGEKKDRGLITVKNISDNFLNDAEVVFSIKNRMSTKRVSFSETGIPQIFITHDYYLRIEEIVDDSFKPSLADDTHNYFSQQLKNRFKQEVQKQCASAINFCKEYNVDPLNFYQLFNRFQHKKWIDYLDSLENPDDYIQNIEIFMDIKVKDVD